MMALVTSNCGLKCRAGWPLHVLYGWWGPILGAAVNSFGLAILLPASPHR